jgi:hypothetical protein
MPQFADDLFLGGNNGQTYMGTGNYAATSVFTGTIAATVLTVVSAQTGDALVVGQYITGSSVTANSYITAATGQNTSGQNTYTLSASSTVSSNTTMTASGNALLGDPAPMSLGVGPLGRIYVFDTVPQTLQAANIAASQTPAAAGALTLTAGTSARSVVRSDGTTVIQLDVPRAVSVTLVTAGTARVYTVSGYDYYGQAMSEAITSVAAATTAGKKAFYQISSIVGAGGGSGTALTFGTTDVIGLPVRVIDAGYVIKAGWNNTLLQNAGTFTAADMTSPATTTTGDVRGTFLPATNAADGSRRLVMSLAVPGIAVGPNATRTGALGVTQV